MPPQSPICRSLCATSLTRCLMCNTSVSLPSHSYTVLQAFGNHTCCACPALLQRRWRRRRHQDVCVQSQRQPPPALPPQGAAPYLLYLCLCRQLGLPSHCLQAPERPIGYNSSSLDCLNLHGSVTLTYQGEHNTFATCPWGVHPGAATWLTALESVHLARYH